MSQDRKVGKPPVFPGRVRLSDYSSLRKLMRAARRGKLSEERLRIIADAVESVARRGGNDNASTFKRYGA